MTTKEYYKIYYKKNKEKYSQRYLDNKEEFKQSSRDYYYDNKKERIKYNKAYMRLRELRNFKRMLKARSIKPTPKDMELMIRAVKTYAAKVAKQTGKWIDYHDYLGAGFESLKIALNMCKDGLTPAKREQYLSFKIAFGIVDIYRYTYGRTGGKRQPQNGAQLMSIHFVNDEDEEKTFYLPASEVDNDIAIDADFFGGKIKEKIMKCKSNKTTGQDLYDMFLMRIEGLSLEDISVKYDICSSRVSQLFSRLINPAFQTVKEALVEEYGDAYL